MKYFHPTCGPDQRPWTAVVAHSAHGHPSFRGCWQRGAASGRLDESRSGLRGRVQVSECIMARTPLCFVRRDHFLEEPYLRRLLEDAGGAIEISRSDLVHGLWAPYLKQALQANMSYECAPFPDLPGSSACKAAPVA